MKTLVKRAIPIPILKPKESVFPRVNHGTETVGIGDAYVPDLAKGIDNIGPSTYESFFAEGNERFSRAIVEAGYDFAPQRSGLRFESPQPFDKECEI